MDELELVLAQRAPELARMRGQADELAPEQQPAAAAVGRGPDVREARDGAGVHLGAGLAEEVGGRAGRAVDVRLEEVAVELPDQVRERLRRTPELGAMVHEENGHGARPRHRPMLASALLRIGVDATTVAPAGKGHARTQRHLVEALAKRDGLELVAFVRDAAAAALLPVETVVVRERPSLVWEQVGLPLRARRLDAVLTLGDRLSLLPQAPTVIWLFESPVYRIEENRRTGAGVYQRTADLVTSRLWRRSLRRAGHVAFGSQATADEVLAELPELDGRTSVVHPGLAPGFGPGPAPDRGRYVFHLGSTDPRDNTAAAVAACRAAGVR